jgi:hypothetical protein
MSCSACPLSLPQRPSPINFSHDRSASIRQHLPNAVLAAFFVACDQGALDIAGDLLRACEAAMDRLGPGELERRQRDEMLILAFEHLWFLRCPSAEASDHACAPC